MLRCVLLKLNDALRDVGARLYALSPHQKRPEPQEREKAA